MPRLQLSRRTSLLSTKQRNTFLEAFSRNVVANNARAFVVGAQGVLDATRCLSTIARRVQADMRRVTGHYFPIYQVVASIHALKERRNHIPTRSGGTTSSLPTLKPLQILVTPTSPFPASTSTEVPLSMSRRRLACNIPALQTRLVIPSSTLSLLSPSSSTPATPFDGRPLFNMSRRSSLTPRANTRSPVTPVDQIVHTPLSPPRIPRAPPPPPRTWGKLNARMQDGISPLISPSLPFTPYVLGHHFTGKPVLNRLQISMTHTRVTEGTELQRGHIVPSPQSLSPFELVPSPLGGGPCSSVALQRRPTPVRNNSTSNLTRAALFRASRPHLVRSSSASESQYPGHPSDHTGALLPPRAPEAPPSPLTLASPFIIRSQEMDTEYFRF